MVDNTNVISNNTITRNILMNHKTEIYRIIKPKIELICRENQHFGDIWEIYTGKMIDNMFDTIQYMMNLDINNIPNNIELNTLLLLYLVHNNTN